jgi:hypothetical protein
VHDVLKSPCRPLDTATRVVMEPRWDLVQGKTPKAMKGKTPEATNLRFEFAMPNTNVKTFRHVIPL